MTVLNKVIGEPRPYVRVPQKSASELQDLLNEVFSKQVYAVAWRQFSDSGDDGSFCVGVGSHVLLTSAVPDDEEYLDPDQVEEFGPSMLNSPDPNNPDIDPDDFLYIQGSAEVTWDDINKEIKSTGLIDPPAYHAVQTLTDGLYSAAYEDVLLEHFGNYCTVIATPSEFIVRPYDND